MKEYTFPALILLLALMGLVKVTSRVVSYSHGYTRTAAVEADYRRQAMQIYDDVEMTNAGKQLEWIQERLKGETPVYRTPEFVRTW
jgi:hypothetical protein